ncbi:MULTISPECIES: F0F1 ATP synthase subunit B' [Helicobacter]|uniref:ATP synthase subunit b n=2 Tax=Helicobacter TaxID=209 RepID=A0ABT0TS29_9HELI|nr:MULTISPECIES: F0F1 ATP synthase subunit B' [Helicobacter]MCI7047015.1 F0F1 ATP synthase subunit B' [Helicobacter sp.]MCI7765649.1 F0F1 ATP synthase subunit B' [Helicobacter sp.]MCL9818725.1 F0F1 ATP synthase subunit B' [Helicobacter colisuis]MCL9820248.1 F0F1 ATP synthase subunit B' [Helicobacter colisuis]MCL9822272.1 F0F1 ATP synthase subunit B' [Helicobacter colisuis]
MTIIPTPWVMALVFFTFLILIYLLNRILYKPLLGFMDARDSSIKKDSEGIEGNAADVKALKAEAEVILQNARQEASLIKNKAQENAKQMADAKITQKREELNLKYNEFTAILEEEREELKKTLLSKIPLFEESLKAKMAKL